MSLVARHLMLLTLVSVAAFAAAPARGQARLSGMVFADGQVAKQGYSVPADSSVFRFRRVQFTLDQDLDSVFAVRFQLEADDAELTSRGKSAMFVKQAWLRWAHLGTLGDLTMGLATTPTWAVVESFWGYRSLEKTVLDLQGLGTATDIGVALQRATGPGRPVGWHLMLSNGNGQKPENNAGKKLALSVPWRFGDVIVEGMGDYTGEPGPHDQWTTRLFVGWQKGADAAGVEAYRRVNAAAGADVVPVGLSAWGRRKLTDHLRAVARIDWTDPNREDAQVGYRETFFLAALDATPHANVHVMPNVLVRVYSAKNPASPDRDTDIALRLTLHYAWR